MRFTCFVLFVMIVTALVSLPAAAASSDTVVYNFTGGSDGGNPAADLVFDSAGNAYGTTVIGGDFGYGTVFELSPSGSTWTETVLYSFTGGTDGKNPYGGVTLDAAGNLYGVTVAGGSSTCTGDGCGVVYKLTIAGGTFTQSVLYSFRGGSDGFGPGDGVIFDKAGNLYGMTPDGGAAGYGSIYELHPTQSGPWKERIIHSFTGGADGAVGALGRMVLDKAGNLYGVSELGGASNAGTVFQLAPGSNGTWTMKTIYSFKGQPDAGFPYGGLVLDASGNLYGVTYYGGANGLGAAYLLHNAAGTWKEKVLYSFAGGGDGNSSTATLIFDASGNLYGTSSAGGSHSCACGTVFQLAPQGKNVWKESVAYSFAGKPDGAFPSYGLSMDGAGNFYGTTAVGGLHNQGAIYQFVP
jgi:uncharacterized repeat protein (TIGR03803 family)